MSFPNQQANALMRLAGQTVGTWPTRYPNRTLAALRKRGLAEYTRETGWQLTETGRAKADELVAALKAELARKADEAVR